MFLILFVLCCALVEVPPSYVGSGLETVVTCSLTQTEQGVEKDCKTIVRPVCFQEIEMNQVSQYVQHNYKELCFEKPDGMLNFTREVQNFNEKYPIKIALYRAKTEIRISQVRVDDYLDFKEISCEGKKQSYSEKPVDIFEFIFTYCKPRESNHFDFTLQRIMSTVNNDFSFDHALAILSKKRTFIYYPNQKEITPIITSLQRLSFKYPSLYSFMENSKESYKLPKEDIETFEDIDCVLLQKLIALKSKAFITANLNMESQESCTFPPGTEFRKQKYSNNPSEFTQQLANLKDWQNKFTKLSILKQMKEIDAYYTGTFYWIENCDAPTAVMVFENDYCNNLPTLRLKAIAFYHLYWYSWDYWDVKQMTQPRVFHLLKKFNLAPENIPHLASKRYGFWRYLPMYYFRYFIRYVTTSLKIRTSLDRKTYFFEVPENLKKYMEVYGTFMQRRAPGRIAHDNLIELIEQVTQTRINGWGYKYSCTGNPLECSYQ